jgi:Na+/H+ antiporter NhaD/arsenite permease-like protein
MNIYWQNQYEWRPWATIVMLCNFFTTYLKSLFVPHLLKITHSATSLFFYFCFFSRLQKKKKHQPHSMPRKIYDI